MNFYELVFLNKFWPFNIYHLLARAASKNYLFFKYGLYMPKNIWSCKEILNSKIFFAVNMIKSP